MTNPLVNMIMSQIDWTLLPSWANYVAWGPDGGWWAFEHKPEAYPCMCQSAGCNCDCWEAPGKSEAISLDGLEIPHWEDLLAIRPDRLHLSI